MDVTDHKPVSLRWTSTDHKPVPLRCTVKVLPSSGARNTMVSAKGPGADGPNSMGYFKKRLFLQQEQYWRKTWFKVVALLKLLILILKAANNVCSNVWLLREQMMSVFMLSLSSCIWGLKEENCMCTYVFMSKRLQCTNVILKSLCLILKRANGIYVLMSSWNKWHQCTAVILKSLCLILKIANGRLSTNVILKQMSGKYSHYLEANGMYILTLPNGMYTNFILKQMACIY